MKTATAIRLKIHNATAFCGDPVKAAPGVARYAVDDGVGYGSSVWTVLRHAVSAWVSYVDIF